MMSFSPTVLLVFSAFVLVAVLVKRLHFCHGCGDKFGVKRTGSERSADAYEAVDEEWQCDSCGWTVWREREGHLDA